MTCIIGLEHGGHVYLGGDSAGVDAESEHLKIRTVGDAKVFKNGDFIIGYTSSFRMGQLLKWAFVPPKRKRNISDMKFLVTTFSKAVEKTLTDNGCKGGTFLVGYSGGLYCFDDEFSVIRTDGGYASIGCGEPIAAGAMHANKHIKDPEKRIINALEAAEELSAGVRGPFTVVKL